MINRQSVPNLQEDRPHLDFSKIKVGVKSLEDATISLGELKKCNAKLSNKEYVIKAIQNQDYEAQREISNYFFRISGIYSRLCRYLAYLYRYDWVVTPYQVADSVKKEKLLEDFNRVLKFLEHFGIKKYFGEVALKVVKNGCYYGYLVKNGMDIQVQELHPKYCRSRYKICGRPAVEFDMKYFDDMFRDTNYRIRILNLFPPEFRKGYLLYKEGKLKPDYAGDKSGWYLLEPSLAFKFNITDEDQPLLLQVIPAIIDLDAAQGLDRERMAQQLLKILIQKMPLDKNGDMVFDLDETLDMHVSAKQMVGNTRGLDVLTTFADVEVEDMADSSTNTATDDLERVERAIYNEAGVSQMQFNTDGNIALEKSILNDEATMYNLICQFEDFLNKIIEPYNKSPKKYYFYTQILTTTIYNYKEMAKLYKEHTQLGYSKMLPMIALGQTQSSILATAFFENDVLDLVNVFIPPMSSNVMNADVLNRNKGGSAGSSSNSGGDGAGRPEKPDDEKSTKTIQNKESQN